MAEKKEKNTEKNTEIKGKPIMASLMAIQQKLVATKDKPNTFGGFKYRSAESILEALKPLLRENSLILTMTDEIENIGNRYYVNATVKITDIVSGESIETSALAREEETKKGMDASQITGSASSYARKYALCGLFCIDDNKDADTDEYQQIQNEAKEQETSQKPQNRSELTQNNHKGKSTTNKAKTSQSESDELRNASLRRLIAVGENFPKEFMVATSKKIVGKEATKDMNAEEIIKVAEELEKLMQEAENHD